MTRRGLFGIFFAAPFARLLPKPIIIPNNEFIVIAAEMIGKRAAESIDKTMCDYWTKIDGLRV